MTSRRAKSDNRDSGAVLELDILTIGAQGDGIAEHDGRRLFVPYTTAGDRVRVRAVGKDRAAVVDWLREGPDRQVPPCPHFGPGRCGGCALQHVGDAAYAAWKLERATEALARAGFPDAALRPLARTPPGARRRAEFAAAVTRHGVTLGFHARASHDIVPIGPCLVLAPALEALLPGLREVFGQILPAPATLDILATQADGGIELVVTASPSPDRSMRERLAGYAAAADLARVAWRRDKRRTEEVIVQRRPLRASFGTVAVDLPPGAFLQASITGERAVQAAVAAATDGAKRVADLYAGCGSLALALAGRQRRIHAADSDREMIAALDAAARRAGLGPQVSTETRDLARRPLTPDELAPFDAVIFDPPREGAAAQASALAASKVRTVAAVSCDPATFARDAQLLAAGGYRLTALTPIDQFLWSPHLELVGEFHR
jgi:23S rRNA (uracil1939-C5)-methyltransferase